MKKEIAIINGPNLNLLGQRQPEIYGTATLSEIVDKARERAATLGFTLQDFQSNCEGELIDAVQRYGSSSAGLIVNAAAFSHTSIAIRDALQLLTVPVIEVHLSNIYARENFRKQSYVSEVARGVICGLGGSGYVLAVDAIAVILSE